MAYCLRPSAARLTLAGASLLAGGASCFAQNTLSGPHLSEPGMFLRGQRMFERIQLGMGGPVKLGNIKDVTANVETVSDIPGGRVTIKQVIQILLPNYFRQTTEGPEGRTTIFNFGRMGWSVGPQGEKALTTTEIREIQGELLRFPPSLALSNRDPTRKIIAAGETSVEIYFEGAGKVRVDFNRENGLPARQSYRALSPEGEAVDTERIFSDWRDLGGIRMPFKVTIKEAGVQTAESTVIDYKFNTGLTADELSRKP
jgi:hypothetical protein